MGTNLESALILLRVLAVNLLNSGYVLLEVAASMLPGLQTLSKQTGAGRGVEVRDSVVIAKVCGGPGGQVGGLRSEEHTSELQSQSNLVCRLLLEKKK